MNVLENKTDELAQWLRKMEDLCSEFSTYQIVVEERERRREVQYEMEQLCWKMKDKLEIGKLQVLLALLDAYEVTRDEGMLQEVLDVVSANMDCLGVSLDAVKLLAYCYYYVEEKECALRAREMLEELKRQGEDAKGLAEMEKVMEELAEGF